MNDAKARRLLSEQGIYSPNAATEKLGISRRVARDIFNPPHNRLFSISEASAQKLLRGLGYAATDYRVLFDDGEVVPDKRDSRRPTKAGRVIPTETLLTSNSGLGFLDMNPDAAKPAASGKFCPNCFMEMSLTGTCACN